MQKNKKSVSRTYAIFGLITAPVIVSGAALSAAFVSADDTTVDAINVVLPISCSMTGSGMNDHSANVANGIYTPNIGLTTFNVMCNDNEGFSIYAAGFTGDSAGTEDSTKLLGTAASDYSYIETGTATSAGAEDVSNWAMKLASDSAATYPVSILSGFDSYHAVPSDFTKVVTRLSGTDLGTGASGASFTSTYAVYASKTQSADVYSGKVKYVLVHPNNDDPFAGGIHDITQLTYMQDFATLTSEEKTSVFNSMTTDRQYQLKDSRDEKTYYLSKLQDGNIWMTQNLDFDLVEGDTLTAEDTDLHLLSNSDDDDDSGDGGDVTPSWTVPAEYATDHISAGTSTSDAKSVDVGNWYFTDQVLPSTQANYLNGGAGDYFSTSQYPGNGAHGHVGNYYDQPTATIYDYGEEYDDDGLFKNSICPAGWSLPAGSSGGEGVNYKIFPDLVTESEYYSLIHYYNDGGMYGGQYMEGAPTYLNRSGTFSGGTFKNAGYDGYYWTSRYISQFFFRSAGADPMNSTNGDRLRSVRCLVRGDTHNALAFTRIYFSPNLHSLGGDGYIDSEKNGYDQGYNSSYNITDENGETVQWSQIMRRGGTIKIAPNKFMATNTVTYQDYTFTGWNTKSDGSGTSYADMGEITSGPNDERIVLYAQWRLD